MTAIFSSVKKCPSLLRLALRQLWLRVAEKYKDPESVVGELLFPANQITLLLSLSLQDIPYLAITGFLFLRFFVPAILSPKLFAVRDEHPDQKTERTLKLISKVRIIISAFRKIKLS